MDYNEEKHKSFYFFLRKFIAPLSLKIFLKKINNFENLNHNKPFIIASNHTSFLDPLIMASIYAVCFNKKLYYIGKKQLFRTLPSKIFHEAIGTILLLSNNRIKKTIYCCNTDKVIFILPHWMGKAFYFKPLINALKNKYTIVLYDLPYNLLSDNVKLTVYL